MARYNKDFEDKVLNRIVRIQNWYRAQKYNLFFRNLLQKDLSVKKELLQE